MRYKDVPVVEYECVSSLTPYTYGFRYKAVRFESLHVNTLSMALLLAMFKCVIIIKPWLDVYCIPH